MRGQAPTFHLKVPFENPKSIKDLMTSPATKLKALNHQAQIIYTNIVGAVISPTLAIMAYHVSDQYILETVGELTCDITGYYCYD